MTNDELMATCIADEAGNQTHEGRVAVGVVILNRTNLPYQSDGTIAGTVLRPGAFSGFSYTMINGVYTKVAFTADQIAQRAEAKFEAYSKQTALWADCLRAVNDAWAYLSSKPLSFIAGPAFLKLRPDVVLYYNPAIIGAPSWVNPANLVTTIGAHEFFRDA